MQKELPYTGFIMVLAIISLFAWFCLGVPGFILSLVALLLYRIDKQRYDSSPGLYSQASFNKLKVGRIIAIIGFVLSSLYLLLVALALIADFEDQILDFPWKLLK